MALPATDTFTGADGTALTTYSANWTYNNGSFALINNCVKPSAGGTNCLARWNADSFNANQYAKIKFAEVYGGEIGVAVRVATDGAHTAYIYRAWEVNRTMYKCVAGSYTQLGSAGAAPAKNDIFTLEANGTTITPKINGTTDATIGAQTDSAIASGAAGLTGYGTTDARGDDWEGGDLAGGGGGGEVFSILPILSDYYRRKKVQ